MFNDDGGVGTVSSTASLARSTFVPLVNVPRLPFGGGPSGFVVGLALFRAGDFAARFDEPGRLVLARPPDAAAARVPERAVLRAPAFFAPLTERAEAPPDRRAATRFAGRAAFRLAMVTSFRNLDSFAISVVLSVAYRNPAKPRGAQVERNSDLWPTAGTQPITQSDIGGRARHGER
jgi:hypothetical protein